MRPLLVARRLTSDSRNQTWLGLGDLSLPHHNRLRLESYDSIGVRMLDLAQVRVEPMKISAELGIELASCFAGLFDDWVFHDVNLPSVPEEYRSAAARSRERGRLSKPEGW